MGYLLDEHYPNQLFYIAASISVCVSLLFTNQKGNIQSVSTVSTENKNNGGDNLQLT